MLQLILAHVFILCSTVFWGSFISTGVPSLQVSNYRTSRAWCDQSNKIDRVRRAQRNWNCQVPGFHSFNSFVQFAKLRPIGSQITGLQFEGWWTQRKSTILKWLQRMWKFKTICLDINLIFLNCRFLAASCWSLESHSKEPTHWNLFGACTGGRQSLVQDGQGRSLSNAALEPLWEMPYKTDCIIDMNNLTCSHYRSYGCVIHPWVHRQELSEATEVVVYSYKKGTHFDMIDIIIKIQMFRIVYCLGVFSLRLSIEWWQVLP